MLSEKLLLELREYVESNSIKIAFALCEAEPYELKNVCRNIGNNELEEFIKNSRSRHLTRFCLILSTEKASKTQKFTKELLLTAGIFPKYVPTLITVQEKIL